LKEDNPTLLRLGKFKNERRKGNIFLSAKAKRFHVALTYL
jgi:hypothetical protein